MGVLNGPFQSHANCKYLCPSPWGGRSQRPFIQHRYFRQGSRTHYECTTQSPDVAALGKCFRARSFFFFCRDRQLVEVKRSVAFDAQRWGKRACLNPLHTALERTEGHTINTCQRWIGTEYLRKANRFQRERRVKLKHDTYVSDT